MLLDLTKPVDLESDLQNWLNETLGRLNIENLHMSNKAREHKGWPDTTFVYQGRAIFVELKSKTGRLSKEQKECLSNLKRNGGEVYVCRTGDECLAVLEGRAEQWDGGIE